LFGGKEGGRGAEGLQLDQPPLHVAAVATAKLASSPAPWRIIKGFSGNFSLKTRIDGFHKEKKLNI